MPHAAARHVRDCYFYAGRPEALPTLVGALPPAEHVEFLRWLLPDDLPADERIKRDVYDALVEASTNDPAARDHLLALRARIPGGTYRQAVEWGLRSLPGGADPPAPRRAATRR